MARKRASLEEVEIMARDIGRLIGKACPEGWGFTLVLCSYGENGLMHYMSNCQRADIIKMLREMANKLEAGDQEV